MNLRLRTATGIALLTPAAVLAVVFVAYPFVVMLSQPLGSNGAENVSRFLESPGYISALWLTYRDSALATVITVVLGGFLAWMLRTSQSRWLTATLLISIFVPFWMGTVTKNYALTVLLARLGPLNALLAGLGITSEPVTLLFNEMAVVFGMVYSLVPYAALPLWVVFRTIDLDLVAAAEGLGASRPRALLSVILPLSAPGLAAVVTLVFVYSIGYFVTPRVLGGGNVPFVANVIWNDLFLFFDVANASLNAGLLIATALAALVGMYVLVGPKTMERALA